MHTIVIAPDLQAGGTHLHIEPTPSPVRVHLLQVLVYSILYPSDPLDNRPVNLFSELCVRFLQISISYIFPPNLGRRWTDRDTEQILA